MSGENVQCGHCKVKSCVLGDFSKSPEFCASTNYADEMEEVKIKLEDEENRAMAQDVARSWKNIGKNTRIEETMQYARNRGYNKLGLAFCFGLSYEAELLTNLFINEGFDVSSATCMSGGLTSDDIGLPEEDKIMKGQRQPMCNPIGQAMILDSEGCELNIVLGLCVGDDTLFIKHSKAPVTVIAVKDSVLAHNPLAVLYTSKNFNARVNTERPKKNKK
ncbi:MAG: DUF1847 domain-containing protein [Desulfobacterales bacterium]|nr:DUF1847 domain-containing protein [Desulfobacteraceae bacterium]MBT4364545.1 DUF1847 domain-containing protein [Desulfobacteraceae bacterium]MBT7085943.1 DUF1847 domain-containing protein [Desulfobacterales bacterium]MBT7696909.1 DUF1847 domain-containing protein [Desulfobacterales bacterium]